MQELSADIALIIEEVGPDLCTIETPTLASDGHGGKQQDWAPVSAELTDLPCIAYPNAAQAKILGEVPMSKTIFSVLVRGGAAVTSKMRVRIKARGTEPERIVEIKSVLPALGVIVEIVGLVSLLSTTLKSNIPNLVAGMKRRAALAARKTASSINADIRVSMGGSKHGKQYVHAGKPHVASAPGEAPAIDEGDYVQTFHSEKVDETTFVVGTTDPRGPALELGGAHVAARPHIGPAFERAKEGFGENMKEIFEG